MTPLDEVKRSMKISKFFKNATHVYWVYGWRKMQGRWQWHLVTAFANEDEYKKYVDYQEKKGRIVLVYHADLVKETTKKVYETQIVEEETDIPEVIIN